ncbi:hypothetical protein [Natrononativus amylolyticus]|uniref:hypothetical protein n=1 Tax=Natrononativus amylolyticus TaxID=2963434 RepID=UPI0020CDAB7B|nr:hypothetical protein [Natrononativus amylolyticus]
MDGTQIALGVALLGVSSLTFAGPAVIDSHLVVSMLSVAALLLGGGALVVGTVGDLRP